MQIVGHFSVQFNRLTEIEDRVLRELALGAGAREVIVYSGSTINTKAENYDAVKTRSRAT